MLRVNQSALAISHVRGGENQHVAQMVDTIQTIANYTDKPASPTLTSLLITKDCASEKKVSHRLLKTQYLWIFKKSCNTIIVTLVAISWVKKCSFRDLNQDRNMSWKICPNWVILYKSKGNNSLRQLFDHDTWSVISINLTKWIAVIRTLFFTQLENYSLYDLSTN